jgi:hypothetical protein
VLKVVCQDLIRAGNRKIAGQMGGEASSVSPNWVMTRPATVPSVKVRSVSLLNG